MKTVGPQTARLIAALCDRAQTTFTNSDVTAITGLEANSARNLVRKAEARGLVTRLKPGLFVLVPPELGSATEFSGNPYVTARAMAGGAEYYISHSSAMELHRMVTQPQFTVFTSTPKRLRVTYSLLDPVMPKEGPRVVRWRLRLNVAPEELEAIRST